MNQQIKNTLYDQSFEHDNCGIGAVTNIYGKKSHSVVADALSIVENLEHRAGKDAEGKTGDGVGILTQIPHKFFKKVCTKEGIAIGGEREYGIGMFFFPQNEMKRRQAMKMFEIIVQKENLEFLGWRKVTTYETVLGPKALESCPDIYQAFIKRPADVKTDLDFDRRLYIVRRVFEQSNESTYVPSLSSRTIVYKGMFLVSQLRTFFADLQDEDYVSAIALVHSRFSTNTQPSWLRAHPNRFIVHNGEINTIKGNVDKMCAREETLEMSIFSDEDLSKVLPIISAEGSDSAMLDNALEFMIMGGMDPALAAMILIPEPWENNDTISQEERDFYQYYATMMEPWDGPAAIMFSDGDVMGAILDRNGLRPSRYYLMDDGRLILSSEVGVLDLDERHILRKERLHPGKMLLVDTKQGKLIDDTELKDRYARSNPYGEWLDANLYSLKDLKLPNEQVVSYSKEELQRLEKAFGYTYEDYRDQICKMALNGSESIGAMGVDTPLAVLSKENQPLFYYFKQLFAQVTNPPIDAVREKIVTATTVYVGKNGNLLAEKPENCHVLKIQNPILSDLDMMKITHLDKPGLKVEKISMLYYKSTPLDRAIEHLFVEVDRAYKNGANILVLSDRGVDENHVAIPSLLCVAAVHNYLVKTKKCMAMSLILETAEPRGVHHFATLLGYGASAVNPYLAHASIKQLIEEKLLDKDYYAAVSDYDKAILSGIVKIASKMGISTIQSYQGSRIFEAVGIDQSLIDKYFPGTVSRIGGIKLENLAATVDRQHSRAFDPLGLSTDLTIASVGRHKLRSNGELHRYNPQTIHMLQLSTREGSYEKFKEYTKMVDSEQSGYLRSLMEFRYPEKGISIEEVEPASEIVKRFKTGAMSYGSISEEAHETLAIAMNHLHGKSNSGEGGESDERLASAGSKNDRSSAIKQVASGRFGVTSKYLISAQEIQIKLAQGAKPGEGGHLPGKKVYPWVAKTRHSTPGVSLISPPPHHDIYSIEDLAQLIYDLKNANKEARISVKLVSETGVGTIAAGVAKAGAGCILISGYDGGTGAAPLSSIHNAGLPWELGLAETHQTLLQNGLRGKVTIETDGKLMSGRDVAIAAILGAEEFGFATAPLVTIGCVMMRLCNQDTCPYGVATQNPELRKKFAGKPEYVENFMLFVAEELREYMARLGVKTVDELVGRTDLICKKEYTDGIESQIDLSKIIDHQAYEPCNQNEKSLYDFELSSKKDQMLMDQDKSFMSAIKNGKEKTVEVELTNIDRAFGTLIGAEITRNHAEGLSDDTITINCKGAGGQSFGAFIPSGLTLNLTGDSNDYFGKGLSGGKLILKAPKEAAYDAENNIIVGNVALYGATSGEAYIAGMAGERFCVRNSGVKTVVEGVGEHGCEYMTGGLAVILGKTGKNFAAGMSGGVAYVLDEDNHLYRNLNKEMVLMEKFENKNDKDELKTMLENHYKYTNSTKAKEILDDFENYLPKFKKIIPADYKKMIQMTADFMEQGMSTEKAQIEAFYASLEKYA
ncbi:glutamate synthase large subunit [Eubacterium oxidoreducens]|uniref:Glutamate synthase (Ferredoxin) n=1 Tax=Eubacterium oxidoreducens TaxID=1732 RepID=A0A1G6BNM4_EUBOX|nr:glutamate synthase large subunit [Eubacterium oxidoreducens]SDB22220.1 glutamate synthase (ferredoxin) [Eubacterium oxidoreducens]